MATRPGPRVASVPLRVDRATYERVRSMAYRTRISMSALASRAIRHGLQSLEGTSWPTKDIRGKPRAGK